MNPHLMLELATKTHQPEKGPQRHKPSPRTVAILIMIINIK